MLCLDGNAGMHMHLDEYLFRKKITTVAMAKRLGVSRVHLYQIKAKRKIASPKLAKAVEIATEGMVSAEELLYPEGWQQIRQGKKSSQTKIE